MSDTPAFIDRLCTAVLSIQASPESRKLIGRALADTVGVAAAGFTEDVTRNVQKCFNGKGAKDWSGQDCESIDAAILTNAVAAHALDFDAVYMGTSVHPNAVLFPALLSDNRLNDPDVIAASFAAGIITCRAVARRLGSYRHHGWHGTGVVGALAAAAAAGRAIGLSAEQLRWALSLAASQAGGMQANFGTMAKSCHAGFAAAAGYRAARMAAASIDAANPFSPKGFIDLYGYDDADPTPADSWFEPQLERLALKLYPCSYGGQRLIGAALKAHDALGRDKITDPHLELTMVVPEGSTRNLSNPEPESGLQAKFSAKHIIAATFTDGASVLEHFSNAAVARTDLKSLRKRISVVAESGRAHDDLSAGAVRLEVKNGGATLGVFEQIAVPGSLQDPPTPEAVRHKIADCLTAYKQSANKDFPIRWLSDQFPDAQAWLPS